jgi:hypothetical protein
MTRCTVRYVSFMSAAAKLLAEAMQLSEAEERARALASRVLSFIERHNPSVSRPDAGGGQVTGWWQQALT